MRGLGEVMEEQDAFGRALLDQHEGRSSDLLLESDDGSLGPADVSAGSVLPALTGLAALGTTRAELGHRCRPRSGSGSWSPLASPTRLGTRRHGRRRIAGSSCRLSGSRHPRCPTS